ncbi:MAG: DUF1156 domain-containing protein [Candidatus Poribacteria bacterium]|nr:DUF1156 domain-containing protein [Candidatus Poribacteria bacterium]
MPRRLIEEAFPLKKVSEDSKHEKNPRPRPGHISTLHMWPARRPLAACRAVTIATLLPDPEDAEEKMKVEYTRLSGSPLPEKQREYLCDDLIASLTRWGDENGHGNWNVKDKKGRWLNKLRIARELILMAYEGNPPKILDMFAGGGAIPFEAMRLGCEVTASDYNSVAWFLLKCTLEYPQRLAGKTAPLPDLNLDEKPNLKNGDLADHVRLWAQWVLENAEKELIQYYPEVDGKTVVAYLWARTIPCQDPQCGATIPLLKTLWVCKQAEKMLPDTEKNRSRSDFMRLEKTRSKTKVVINRKRALKLYPDPKTKRVRFEIITPKNADDVGQPTRLGSNVICPFCGAQQPANYIKTCGQESKFKAQMTAVVYQESYGDEYRAPTQADIDGADVSKEALEAIADQIPYGIPNEPLPSKERHRAVGSQLPDYGFKTWESLFTLRQLLSLMTFVKWTRAAWVEMENAGYFADWREAIQAYLGILTNRLANYTSTICIWETATGAIKQVFLRYALPITWDFAESNPLSHRNRYYRGSINSVERVLRKNCMNLLSELHCPDILNLPAQRGLKGFADAIITDPPYYDAIPYADISDFFYVWLRRSIGDRFPSIFDNLLTPKVEELVQHHKTGVRGKIGKQFYENGMAESFQAAHDSLDVNGRIVIVFAHKSPEAWETLVRAMIEAGLVVTASWPIDTELQGGLKVKIAALATSLWLVCRKRSTKAKAGHYGKVKREMQKRITERLRYFWDQGIRGPDFVWAAIGPALESYSSHKEVKRLDGKVFTVTEFLTEVRRMVTDFALGQILHGASTEALDEWTRYYLMHKDYFRTENAPVGECILLAQGYGVPLDDLRAAQTGILKKASSGNALKLLGHTERTSDRIGYAHTSGKIPMIDMIHKVMKLWDAGESAQINAYFHEYGLQENPLFKAVVQALIETSPQGSSERSLLETLINYEPGEPVSGVSGPGRSDSDVVQPELPLGEGSS